jgi:hypothetical protein
MGGKSGRCVVLTNLPPSLPFVLKSGSVNFLDPSGPVQVRTGIHLSVTFCSLFRSFHRQGEWRGLMRTLWYQLWSTRCNTQEPAFWKFVIFLDFCQFCDTISLPTFRRNLLPWYLGRKNILLRWSWRPHISPKFLQLSTKLPSVLPSCQ